jgi:PAS domain S-box-containing protein
MARVFLDALIEIGHLEGFREKTDYALKFLKSFSGREDVLLCLKGFEFPYGHSNECNECRKRTDPDYPLRYLCLFADRNGYRVFPLESKDTFSGYLVFPDSPQEKGEMDYTALKTFLDLFSILLENSEQKTRIRELHSKLGQELNSSSFAMEKFKESELRMMNLYNNMTEGVGLHTLVYNEDREPVNYRIVGINPAFEKILNIPEKEVVNALATDAYNVPEPPLMKEYLEVVKTGEPHEFEVYFAPMDKHFSISVSPWGPEGFATIFTDITERKRIDDVLHESENKYRMIFENIQDVFYKIDLDGKIVDISPSINRYSGFTREELLGKQSLDVYLIPEERSNFMEKLMGKGEVTDYDVQFKNKDGEGIWASVNVHLVRDQSGNPTGLEGSLRDVTARKLAEERLLESEVKFRSLAENSPYAIMIFQDDHWVYTNPAGEEISGYSASELYGMTFWEFVDPEFRDVVKLIGQRRQAGENVKTSYEFRIITKTGQAKWVYLTGNSTFYSGKPSGIISAVDISDRKKMELALKDALEKAQESDRLKSAFLANMSHEIRTPMNAILGFSELIGQPHTSQQEQEQFTGIIRSSGKRLLHIIDDIIDISKLEAKQVEISNVPCDVCELVKTTVEAFRNMEFLRQKNKLNIVSDIKDFSPGEEVETDPIRLQQILDNLITNAIKYSSEGNITIGLRKNKEGRKSFMEFFVRDNGKGISPEKYSIIFERFRQVEENEYHEGAGLGLSICKAFIELMGGSINIESELGKGSVFTFFIPLIPVQADKTTVLPAPQRISEDLRGKTILIGEDEDDSFFYIQLLLKETNALMQRAVNGNMVMEMLAGKLPDLLLLDINMPGKTGYDCLREIRQKGYSLKVIVQTAYAMADEKKRCIDSGCDGYLPKPFTKKDLLDCIKEVIRHDK